jgi:hypothetical protein
MQDEEDGIEEVASSGGASAARLVRSESRWVDGSEVDSAESPPWFDDSQEPSRTFSGGSSIRRRLAKKPKRVDSLDVEAMSLPGAHNHDHKVLCRLGFHCFIAMYVGKLLRKGEHSITENRFLVWGPLHNATYRLGQTVFRGYQMIYIQLVVMKNNCVFFY